MSSLPAPPARTSRPAPPLRVSLPVPPATEIGTVTVPAANESSSSPMSTSMLVAVGVHVISVVPAPSQFPLASNRNWPAVFIVITWLVPVWEIVMLSAAAPLKSSVTVRSRFVASQVTSASARALAGKRKSPSAAIARQRSAIAIAAILSHPALGEQVSRPVDFCGSPSSLWSEGWNPPAPNQEVRRNGSVHPLDLLAHRRRSLAGRDGGRDAAVVRVHTAAPGRRRHARRRGAARCRRRDDGARARRPAAHQRRPVRRDQGGPRRLLRHRRARPRRLAAVGREAPECRLRLGRGAAGHGVRRH